MNKILKSIKLGNCAVEVGFVAAAVDAPGRERPG